MCGFKIHSNGNDDSKNGFVWKKGTANWIMNNELEGPDMGKFLFVLFKFQDMYKIQPENKENISINNHGIEL